MSCRKRVTDNAANMAKMRRHLEENLSRDLLTYGCSAHLLNLSAKDVEITEALDRIQRDNVIISYTVEVWKCYKQI